MSIVAKFNRLFQTVILKNEQLLTIGESGQLELATVDPKNVLKDVRVTNIGTMTKDATPEMLQDRDDVAEMIVEKYERYENMKKTLGIALLLPHLQTLAKSYKDVPSANMPNSAKFIVSVFGENPNTNKPKPRSKPSNSGPISKI